MIVDFLLDLVEGVFNVLMSIFPTTSFNPVSYFAGALGILSDVNYWFPVAELMALLVGFLAVMIPLGIVNLGLWIAAFLRGGSSRG